MTRAEAIRFMKKVWRETVKDSFAEEAYNMAIKALEEIEQSCSGCRFFCSKSYYDGVCKTCTRNYSDRYVKEGEEYD